MNPQTTPKEGKMNTNRAQAQKLDSVMTFYVILMVVLSAIAFGTFVMIHDVIPAVQDLVAQVQGAKAP